jgi:Flp pilus assembly protein CpaB
VSRHRRPITAALVGLSVLAGISAVRVDRTSVPVLVAAHDLGPGTLLRTEDLTTSALPAAAVPAGALTTSDSGSGRVLAAAVRRGEPLTDVRLVGRPLLRLLPAGSVAVSVPVDDPDLPSLVQPGDRVDVLAPPGQNGTATSARLLASAALVLAVPGPVRTVGGVLGASPGRTSASGSAGTAALILAVPQSTGGTIVAAAAGAPLAVLLAPASAGP